MIIISGGEIRYHQFPHGQGKENSQQKMQYQEKWHENQPRNLKMKMYGMSIQYNKTALCAL